MNEREALKLALDALQGLINKTSGQAIYSFMETERRIAMSACVGIKEALAQPDEQLLVANILSEYGLEAIDFVAEFKKAMAQPKQEPLCNAAMLDEWFLAKIGLSPDAPLYTTPPQREWVGLTDEKVRKICGSVPALKEAVREAEAYLKEKNG